MTKFTVVVGIESYKNVNKVLYASNDALAFRNAMITNGCVAENVRVLLNEDATTPSIMSTLQRLTYEVKDNDEVIFFFAGHGEIFSNQQYLITYETHYSDIPNTALSLDKLFGLMRNFTRVTFFLDSCHSGMPIKTLQRSSEELTRDPFEAIKTMEYQVAFASCKNGEKSYGSDSLQHGTWTYYVVKALTGEAPSSFYKSDGTLTSSALQEYLSENVPLQVKREQGEDKGQTPWFFGGLTRDFYVRSSQSTNANMESQRTEITPLPYENVIDKINIDSFHFKQKGSVKSLSGFKRGSHKEPTFYSKTTRDFVTRIANVEIHEMTQDYLTQIQHLDLYKDSEIHVEYEEFGSIDCNEDFFIQVFVDQDKNKPNEYVMCSELIIHSDRTEVFKSIFPNLTLKIFDRILYTIPKRIILKDTIQILENETEEDNVLYSYTPGSNIIEIELNDMNGKITLSESSDQVEYFSNKSLVNEVYEDFNLFINSIQSNKVKSLVLGE
ncbi:hypothetical protein J2S74_001500 [Evansella vedderi]|uniref:Peptidase C14 caspase domain-containing protein n=1 Tax=Evansella vedderi TaxID=38282 RepID=A0ABT9ZTT2_9BACI|nr:caspase family protein [Evansella vedderi]MDQ0254127.1 hypothetical protein [Evansella vedderi]